MPLPSRRQAAFGEQKQRDRGAAEHAGDPNHDHDEVGDDDNSIDNVAACERWVDTVSCGDFDFSMLVDCDLYEDTVCDISDYFDCLSDNTECNDGVPDTQGWQNCAEEAECD